MPPCFIYIHTPAQYEIKEMLRPQDQRKVWQLQIEDAE